MTVALAAALLLAAAAWLITPPWRDERSGRLHGTTDENVAGLARKAGRSLLNRWGMGPASRRRRAGERLRIVHALAGLAAELQAGQPPTTALVSSGGSPSAWPSAATAVRLGEDVPSALLTDGAGQPALRQLSACWTVAIESGSGLAAAVGQLAAAARVAEDVRVQLEAELAGPRATARTLSLLPLIGMGFGVMMGADPLGWLLGSGVGLTVLVVGAALTALGAWWTGRIAARVEAML
jgi:tight adherence protein B